MLELNSRCNPSKFHTENNSTGYSHPAMQKTEADSRKPHERINERLDEIGMKKAELARKLGYGTPSNELDNLYKYLAGTVKNPRSEMVDEIAVAIGLTSEYIRRGSVSSSSRNFENSPPPVDVVTFPPNVGSRTSIEGGSFVRVPMRGKTMGGKDGAIIFSTSDNMGDVLAPPQLFNVPDAYAVQVVGESMLERFKDGWVCFVHPHRRVVKGDDCVIQIQNDDGPDRLGYVKEYISWDENSLKVLQLNPRKIIKFPTKSVVSVHKIIMSGPAA